MRPSRGLALALPVLRSERGSKIRQQLEEWKPSVWNEGTVGFIACGESGRLEFAAPSAGVLQEEAGGCCELSVVMELDTGLLDIAS